MLPSEISRWWSKCVSSISGIKIHNNQPDRVGGSYLLLVRELGVGMV